LQLLKRTTFNSIKNIQRSLKHYNSIQLKNKLQTQHALSQKT